MRLNLYKCKLNKMYLAWWGMGYFILVDEYKKVRRKDFLDICNFSTSKGIATMTILMSGEQEEWIETSKLTDYEAVFSNFVILQKDNNV